MRILKIGSCLAPAVLVLVVLGAPALRGAGAESGSASWEALRSVAPDSTVRVVLKNAESHDGNLKAVTDHGLSIFGPTGEKTFARDAVLRVSAKGESHRKRNLLIGLAAGATAGVILGVADPELGQGKCEQGSCIDAGTVAITTVGGAIVGSAVGAVIPTGGWKEVFRAPAPAAAQAR